MPVPIAALTFVGCIGVAVIAGFRRRNASTTQAPELNIDERWKCATAADAQSLLPHAQQLASMINTAKGKGMVNLLVDFDLSFLGGLARPACIDPATKKMRVVIPLGDEDTYPDGVHHSKSVAVIVWREAANGEKEYLVVKEKNRHWKSFVAGGLKWKEDSVEGAKREVAEEVGLELDDAEFKWLQEVEMNGRFGEINTLTTFAAKVKDAKAEYKLQESEIEYAQWLKLEEALKELTFETAKKALTAFAAGRGAEVQPYKRGRLWSA